MDVYRIGVSIILTNSILPALTALSAKFMGMNNTVTLLNRNLGAMKQVAFGVAGILGGAAIFGGMAKLAEHGAAVNHQLELMKVAGMSNAEIQDATGAAMATTASNMTTHFSENLQHIRELRYAFGDVGVAMQHLDEISKSNTILNAVKGGGGDQVWELVKSLEQKGLTFDPAAFSSYVNTMTKVTEATGGKVTPKDFMSTFKYGRTAMLGWDEDFVGGALPRLMQSMGSGSGSGGPGNALMSAFAKVVQGQMPKNAAEEFARMGLAPGGAAHIKGSSDSQLPGGIAGRDQFMANPYEWVQKTLMPALAAHNITSQNDVISQVSKMFPVRTASQIISEMGLQGRFHEGMNSPFEKDIGLQRGAMSQPPAFAELMKNDYPTAMKAFNAQFKSLLEVLGSSLIQPGGPVLTAISAMTSAMSAMSQFSGAHPEVIKGLAIGLGVLGAALMGGGVVAILAALGPAGWIAAGLIGLGAAIYGLTKVDWSAIGNQIKADFTGYINLIKSDFAKYGQLIGSAATAMGNQILTDANTAVAAITNAGHAIGAAIAGIASSIAGGFHQTPGVGSGASSGTGGVPLGSPMRYTPPPGGGGGRGVIVNTYLDGNKLNDHMTRTMVASASGPLQGGYQYDHTRGIGDNDFVRIG